ncbi:MAG TPA: TolC family protein [Anaeromyxobacteraceae bacterium]|nr:TolC family protein [Anaeromyxobacteraceae bacterium]
MLRSFASLALLLAAAAAAQEPHPTAPPDPTDPLLDALIAEALTHRPEHAQASAVVEAERERVPQAGALPDPMLSVGIQNDGFKEIQIGKMETSYLQFMVTQPFFFPGKRGLRSDVARLGADAAEAAIARVRLSIEAEVRRGYLELLLARDQLALLERTEALWEQSEKLARTRYAVGEGAQSDLLRAQLERMRLRQQRLALEVRERNRLQELNRLRGRPLAEPLPTTRRARDLADPSGTTLEEALADAEARSPELAQARLAQAQAERRVALARRETLPDFSVSAGIMARGQLDPMWALSFGVNLPVWSGSKQDRAVAESAARARGAGHGEQAVRELLRLRTEERLALLASARDTTLLFRQGLLVQSEAVANSTLSQYQTGSVPFASVLDALNAWIATQNGFLDAVGQLHRVAIAQRELSLESPSGPSGAMQTGPVPGAGSAMGGQKAMGSAAGAGAAAAEPDTGGATSSGGM